MLVRSVRRVNYLINEKKIIRFISIKVSVILLMKISNLVINKFICVFIDGASYIF